MLERCARRRGTVSPQIKLGGEHCAASPFHDVLLEGRGGCDPFLLILVKIWLTPCPKIAVQTEPIIFSTCRYYVRSIYLTYSLRF